MALPSLGSGRFGAWANGPIDDPTTMGGSSAPTSGPTTDPSGTGGGGSTSPSSGGIVNSGGYGGGGANPIPMPSAAPASAPFDPGAIVSPVGSGGNGGGYGMNGGGGINYGVAGGQSAPATTRRTMAFDDGGEIPGEPEDDNDADDQDVTGGGNTSSDPMDVIRAALGFGRKQMGMPASFYGTDTGDQGVMPGMDDGGVVPTQDDQQQGTGGNLPDPRKTMMYLAGAGAVSPDIASAMEQRVDPQGQMDPAERVMNTVAAAPSPAAQFGLLQHYRSRFNAHSAAAQAALDQGNMAQAAQHATAAMANAPTGHSVQFAPARGGLAVSAKKIGGQKQQQGFDDGGAVDADNPAVIMRGAQRSYDDGGQVPPDVAAAGDAAGAGVIPADQEDDTDQEDTQEPVIPNAVEGNPVSDTAQAAPEQAEPEASQEEPSIAQALLAQAKGVRDTLGKGWDWIVERAKSHEGESGYGLPGILHSLAGGTARGIAGAAQGVEQGVTGGVNWLTGNGPDVQEAAAADQPQTPAPAEQPPARPR